MGCRCGGCIEGVKELLRWKFTVEDGDITAVALASAAASLDTRVIVGLLAGRG